MKLMIQTTAILIFTTAFLLGMPAQAQTNSVYSVNIVGFQQAELDGPSKLFMMAAPFESGDQTLVDIFGTNSLVQSGTPAGADKIRYWDNAEQKYVSVAQFQNVFYRLDATGNYILPPLEDNAVIPFGRGFWIDTSGSMSGERAITLSGDVVLDEQMSVDIVPGLQIIAVPFSQGLALQDMSFLASGATAGSAPGGADQIRVWNVEEQQYTSYALFVNDGKWYRLDENDNWELPPQEAVYTFSPGEAFWYFARNSFTWTEESPYANLTLD